MAIDGSSCLPLSSFFYWARGWGLVGPCRGACPPVSRPGYIFLGLGVGIGWLLESVAGAPPSTHPPLSFLANALHIGGGEAKRRAF